MRNAKEAANRFWQAASIQDATQALHRDSAFRYLAEAGVQAQRPLNQGLQRDIDQLVWIEMALQKAVEDIGNRLQGGLGFLASVASTAPFVGLFGTVWGVYHALTAIGIAGQASIGKVAGPVGEALIMTAIGLAVAVPAVLGYNWLVRRNKLALAEVRSFSAQLYQFLIATKLDK
jgi:biopolymer transport protein ExbB